MQYTAKQVAKTKHNLPWWLEEGSEICPACGQTYVYQTEYRCADCDGPICSMCIVETTAIYVCSSCCEAEE